MSEKTFLAGWRKRLEGGELGVVLVEVEHPLEIYVGSSDTGLPLVQIRSTVRPKLSEISDLVLVSRNEYNGHWVLSLALQDTRFTEVFMRLVSHLVTTSRRGHTAGDAWVIVDGVLDEWKRLLRSRPLGVLSLEQLRGLIGEVWLLLNHFSENRTIDQVLAGWLGPLGSPQDFWFEDSGYHEAKSIGPTASHVKISSAHQLDEPGMELLVLHVPQVTETDSNATTLVGLVGQVTAALDDAGLTDDELLLRLKRLGVDLRHPYYSDNWFRITQIQAFAVLDDFPALRHSLLPDGVERVRYSLARGAIAPFLTATIPV